MFDAALAQLVVHFMADPVQGLTEMRRVARAGGVVAACVWDHAGHQTPLAPFWQGVRELDPDEEGEGSFAGAGEGQLTELFHEAGLREIEETALPVRLEHATFEEWWEPFTLGVGPAGAYVSKLDPERQAELRERIREQLPEAPFTLPARAWAARGLA
jgi:SAM-dependent methyltransferase